MSTWIGFRVPGGIAPFDVLFAIALLAIGALVLFRGLDIRLPGWLLLAAGGLAASALVAALFVPDVPTDTLVPWLAQSAVQTGALPGSNLAGLIRLEWALLIVPIIVSVVAASSRRARLLADLWLLSAAAGAAVAMADAVTGIGLSVTLTGQDWGVRYAGLSNHPNNLGLACAMALPLSLLRSVETRGIRRAAFLAVVALLLGAVLASGSRMGVVAIGVALTLSWAAIPPLRRTVLVLGSVSAVAILLGAVFAGSDGSLLVAVERLTDGDPLIQEANNERIDQLEKSYAVAEDHAFTGVGFSTIADAHSLPVQFLEAGGILALLSFGIFSAWALYLGWRLSWNSMLPPDDRRLAAALTVGVAVWLVCGLLQPAITDRYLFVPIGILLGLQASLWRESAWDEPGATARPRSWRPRPRALSDQPVRA